MCNLYSLTTNIEAIREIVREFDVAHDIGNFAPQTSIYPDFLAPIIRNRDGLRELTKVRWGMPSPNFVQVQAATKRAKAIEKKEGRALSKEEFKQLLADEPDRGVTNVRNLDSAHWKKWFDPKFRCVVPFTSFSEFNKDAGGDIWFAFDVDRPVAFFAGLWAPQWTGKRSLKGERITSDLFAFLTTDPNKEVKAIHPKAMPVILRTAEEVEIWMTAPWAEAQKLVKPLPNGALEIVARGAKKDPED
ncbi:SOS response-associated peptidase [Terrarubrum flagellatum]|uniref:SOS response-associated peptidase n=1 Tax=Terrirubrum flagellatum TaxID=2895980 RepID=UPI0031455F5C